MQYRRVHTVLVHTHGNLHEANVHAVQTRAAHSGATRAHGHWVLDWTQVFAPSSPCALLLLVHIHWIVGLDQLLRTVFITCAGAFPLISGLDQHMHALMHLQRVNRHIW